MTAIRSVASAKKKNSVQRERWTSLKMKKNASISPNRIRLQRSSRLNSVRKFLERNESYSPIRLYRNQNSGVTQRVATI